jgi:hypothetical protein
MEPLPPPQMLLLGVECEATIQTLILKVKIEDHVKRILGRSYQRATG